MLHGDLEGCEGGPRQREMYVDILLVYSVV